MRLIVNKLVRQAENKVIQTYAESFVWNLRFLGHEVYEIGPGHKEKYQELQESFIKTYDAIIDLDCGRDESGNLNFIVGEEGPKPPIKSVVWFTDTHGHPSLHRRISKYYDYVFFAVWDKRDLFRSHPLALWLPNATDLTFFAPSFKSPTPRPFDVGFFSSKGGLTRAEPLVKVCRENGWIADVREVGRQYKHRWPRTAQAMGECKLLFNHGQKKDLNLRIFESMAMEIPLVSDRNDRCGMDLIFTPWVHYIPYESHTYEGLKEAIQYGLTDKNAENIARDGHNQIRDHHLMHHRVDTIISVLEGK